MSDEKDLVAFVPEKVATSIMDAVERNRRARLAVMKPKSIYDERARLQRLTDEMEEWKQAAQVEAGLRREFYDDATRLFELAAELDKQQHWDRGTGEYKPHDLIAALQTKYGKWEQPTTEQTEE